MINKTEDTECIDQFMRDVVESNLLKYAAGQNIFCPVCQEIMDWRKTTIATVYGIPDQSDGEEILVQYTLCSSCYDKRKVILADGIYKAKTNHPQSGVRLELVDGRESRFDGIE